MGRAAPAPPAKGALDRRDNDRGDFLHRDIEHGEGQLASAGLAPDCLGVHELFGGGALRLDQFIEFVLVEIAVAQLDDPLLE
jgi:hypothetical protein